MHESADELLKGIQRTLDELKSVFILANQEALKKEKERLLPQGSMKQRIYDLCDGDRTTSDIAREVEKQSKYVSSYLSILRREGLIRTVETDEETVHEQII